VLILDTTVGFAALWQRVVHDAGKDHVALRDEMSDER
jgi:hypothetical protein